MLRRTTTFFTGVLCFGITGLAVAQQTTFLTKAHQGEGNKGVSFRPVDSTGEDASFVLTARSLVANNEPMNPDAGGQIGTIVIDKGNLGAGVQTTDGSGSRSISGSGTGQNEELTFLFDAAVPVSSLELDLVDIEFGNGAGNADDPVFFLFSYGNMGVYDFAIQEAEIAAAFTSTGGKNGQVDFSQFTSVPSDLMIHELKVRETRGDFSVSRIANVPVQPCNLSLPNGKVAICHIPPGNPSNSHTIVVSQNAIPAHLAHGDFLGNCEDCPGACCFDNGTCFQATQSRCGALGGNFLGQNTSCDDCPNVTGACCFSENGCIVVSEVSCEALGGDFRGIGTSCDDCPAQVGACCLDGGCQVISAISCDALNGDFQGAGTTCDSCPVNTGACCLGGGACLELSQAQCNTAGGNFLGTATDCADCPDIIGACCLGANNCLEISALSCRILGGAFLGAGTDCDDCPADTGACCLENAGCTTTSQSGCMALNGNYLGNNTSCDDCPSLTGACCFTDQTCLEISAVSCAILQGDFRGVGTTCADCPRETGACCLNDGSCIEVGQADCAADFQGVGTTCTDADGDGVSDICGTDRCPNTEPEAVDDGRVTTDGCSILTCSTQGPYKAPCLPSNPGIVAVQLDGKAYGQVLDPNDPRFGVTTSVWSTESPFITFDDPTDPKTIMRVNTAPPPDGLGCPNNNPVDITLTCTFTEIDPPTPGGPRAPGDIILETSDTTTVTTVADCNQNGIDDVIDIQQMSTTDPCLSDCNMNGVPDCCDVDPSDPDNNGQVSEDQFSFIDGQIVEMPDGFPDECIAPPCCFDNCPCELLPPDVCTARGGTPQLSAMTCDEAGCSVTPCDDGDPCTENVCVDGQCQFIPIDDPTPCCLPDGTCQVLPCSAACDAMGGTPTDSCRGSTTVSLLPTAIFRTPVTICGGGAACPAAIAALFVGLGSLKFRTKRRRRRGVK